MKMHNYLTRINDDTWMDLQRVRELDNRSANSLINEGVRLVIADKLQKISQKKTKEHSALSLNNTNTCTKRLNPFRPLSGFFFNHQIFEKLMHKPTKRLSRNQEKMGVP